ncbi:MAG: hypothetical protein IPP20_05225 [Gemmatimonadetes bacterium]|nr:hypothetical protein [Gemmatimonadota bacterium]
MNPVTDIRERRNVGRVSCALIPHTLSESAMDLADRAVQSVGLRALEDAWLEISESDAESIATGILHRDLAYHTEIMPLALAAELASELLSQVPQPMTCFTNGDWAEAFSENLESLDSVGFDPISDAALDAGIICVGDGVTALLWVEDED